MITYLKKYFLKSQSYKVDFPISVSSLHHKQRPLLHENAILKMHLLLFCSVNPPLENLKLAKSFYQTDSNFMSLFSAAYYFITSFRIQAGAICFEVLDTKETPKIF